MIFCSRVIQRVQKPNNKRKQLLQLEKIITKWKTGIHLAPVKRAPVVFLTLTRGSKETILKLQILKILKFRKLTDNGLKNLLEELVKFI